MQSRMLSINKNAARRLLQQRGFSGKPAGKVYPSAAAAVADIKDGAKLCVGGFGLCGIPEFLIQAVVDAGPKYVVAFVRLSCSPRNARIISQYLLNFIR
jgi:hypothetical protein